MSYFEGSFARRGAARRGGGRTRTRLRTRRGAHTRTRRESRTVASGGALELATQGRRSGRGSGGPDALPRGIRAEARSRGERVVASRRGGGATRFGRRHGGRDRGGTRAAPVSPLLARSDALAATVAPGMNRARGLPRATRATRQTISGPPRHAPAACFRSPPPHSAPPPPSFPSPRARADGSSARRITSTSRRGTSLRATSTRGSTAPRRRAWRRPSPSTPRRRRAASRWKPRPSRGEALRGGGAQNE